MSARAEPRGHRARPPGRNFVPQAELPLAHVHACPTGCGVKDVPAEWCMCKRCWFLVPKRKRDELWSAYRHRNEGRAAFAEYRRAVADAIATVHAAREAGL